MLLKTRQKLTIISVKAKKCIYKPKNVESLKDLRRLSLNNADGFAVILTSFYR